ncbi:MAG: hypothetical protein COB04_18585 [Gammaproteobacteria bacterium]|nr:MAG: hypothetical protein COB04_18585 [Gammaproteobacteria bacterium]
MPEYAIIISLLVGLFSLQLKNWENKIRWPFRALLFCFSALMTAQIFGVLKSLPDNYLEQMIMLFFEPWGFILNMIILMFALQGVFYSVCAARFFKSLQNW